MKKLMVLALVATLFLASCGGGNDAEMAALQAQMDLLMQQMNNQQGGSGDNEAQAALQAENEALKAEIAALQAEVENLKFQLEFSGIRGLLLECRQKIVAESGPVEIAKAYEYQCKNFTDQNGKVIPVDLVLILTEENVGYIYDNKNGSFVNAKGLPEPKTGNGGFVFDDIRDVYSFLKDFEAIIVINNGLWADSEILDKVAREDVDAVNAALK